LDALVAVLTDLSSSNCITPEQQADFLELKTLRLRKMVKELNGRRAYL
jgi:hypothetical protein